MTGAASPYYSSEMAIAPFVALALLVALNAAPFPNAKGCGPALAHRVSTEGEYQLNRFTHPGDRSDVPSDVEGCFVPLAVRLANGTMSITHLTAGLFRTRAEPRRTSIRTALQ